jgi:RNA polymerase sigma-70 factor (ECF subfamily)
LERGLLQMEPLAEVLDAYHLFHAARADVLRRLRRWDESRAAYMRALSLATNRIETAYLEARLDALPTP